MTLVLHKGQSDAQPAGRGVWVDPFPPPDTAAYTIILSNGDRFRWELPAERVTEHTEPNLWRWLDQADPEHTRAPLTLVRGGLR